MGGAVKDRARRRRRRAASASAPVLAFACFLTGCKDDGRRFVVIVNPGNRPPLVPPRPTPSPPPAGPTGRVTLDVSFDRTAQGWVPVFADYTRDRETLVAPDARIAPLPDELGRGRGFRLSSAGNGGTLFSGLWRSVTGLRPYTSYRVDTTIAIATNVPAGCRDAFGRAGEDQVVKAGGSGVRPEPSRTGTMRLPLDKGTLGGSGRNMVVLGDLTVPGPAGCASAGPFRVKTMSTGSRGPVVATDSIGRLWLIVGVDSTYRGRSSVYLLGGRIDLSPMR